MLILQQTVLLTGRYEKISFRVSKMIKKQYKDKLKNDSILIYGAILHWKTLILYCHSWVVGKDFSDFFNLGSTYDTKGKVRSFEML